MILDEERLRAERQDRKSWKSRVTGIEEFGPPGFAGGSDNVERPRRQEQRARRHDEEDLEYKLAIEASKNEAEEEKRRRERTTGVVTDDDDLKKAIKLSKEEEDRRRRELEEANNSILIDDSSTAQPAISQPTGYNQGYQQQGAVDWYGNLVDQQQQQPQSTGYLNNVYSQPGAVQNQQTGFQNGYGYAQYQQQPQQTGFEQAFQPQQGYIQPQQTAFNVNNPYGQQANGFGDQGLGQQQSVQQQPQQQVQQPLQQQDTLQPGSHNPWAAGLQQQSQGVRPQPTGSNNPFASSFNRPQSAGAQRPPTLGTLQEQKTLSQFNNTNFNPPVSFPPPQQSPLQQGPPQKEMTPHQAHLNALLATGEGQDTFGNVGNLRIPAQHTAPGTFVNSAGAGANRLTANQTSANPFLNSQFTGLPQQNRILPAQTGPPAALGGNPYGGGNPFGPGQQGRSQQQQQQQQGGSLIDI